MLNTTPVNQHPSLPFPRPQGGDQYVAAAARANGAAVADLQAQRARPRFSGFGTDLTGAHAKINNVIQRLESIWQILTEHVSDSEALADEHDLRLLEARTAIGRIDEWTAETAADVNELQAQMSWCMERIRLLLDEREEAA